MTKQRDVAVYVGEALGDYGFPDGHPFGPTRMDAFWNAAVAAGLRDVVLDREPVTASAATITRFHTPEYVARVMQQSRTGRGTLDLGDTPAFPGVFEAAATVVGSTLDALDSIFTGRARRAFVPIAGLHHARRDGAAGFCVFNDCGVAIETLRSEYQVRRIAYVDIDAHHGDGVFYAFEEDRDLAFADLHEDGRFLYPGTGASEETGKGEAAGTKLNVPLPPGSDDQVFMTAWPLVETYLKEVRPDFILFQCGADSVAGDPLTHMRFSPRAHAYAAERLCALADEFCEGRLLAMGGGGYNLDNLARAWTGVLRALL